MPGQACYHSGVSEPESVSLDEAVALAREIAESLGGRQARAIEVIIRYAERSRRLSKTAISSVGSAAQGVQHFARAQEELARGMEELQHTTHAISKAATAGEENERPTVPPPPESPSR